MQVHIPSISYVESVWKKIQQNFVNCHFIIKCPFDFPVLGPFRFNAMISKISCIFVNISSFSTLGLIIDLNLVNKMRGQAEEFHYSGYD